VRSKAISYNASSLHDWFSFNLVILQNYSS